MRDDKTRIEPEEDDSYYLDMLEKQNSVASGMECTGMMYRPPQDEYEAESYNEIYVVPKVPNKKEKELRD